MSKESEWEHIQDKRMNDQMEKDEIEGELTEKEIEDRSGEPDYYEDEDYPPSNEKMEYYKRGGRV